MSYAQMWQNAKNQYTASAQAKKPSPKFLGFIKKSTGVEPACTALDTALAANDTAAAIKALAQLREKGENYLKVLTHEASGDNATKALSSAAFAVCLKNILDDATKKVTKSGNPTIVEAIGPGAFSKVASLSCQNNDGLKHFCTAATILHDYSTGQNNPQLGALQNRAKAALAQYVAGKDAFTKFRDKTMPRAEIEPFCAEALKRVLHLLHHEIHEPIQLWQRHQDAASKAVGTVQHKAYEDSLEFQLANDAVEAITADVDLLTEAVIDLGGNP